ncbi:hypothetical protein ACFWMU_31645 [Streptomyces sp. NPDC058357]|uniref:hypothetical protein n=1 Tax=unclassified Streptomyces TaxID=2593676 RepID=UPI003663621E
MNGLAGRPPDAVRDGLHGDLHAARAGDFAEQSTPVEPLTALARHAVEPDEAARQLRLTTEKSWNGYGAVRRVLHAR